MTWPLYSDNIVSGIVASSVVWLSAAKFLLVGLKVIHDPNFASSMGAASGQEHILLQGPVQYGTVIATLTMTHFKSPFSIVPIGVLCGGDAMAALFGSRYGEQRLPWNKNKVRLEFCIIADMMAGTLRGTADIFCHFCRRLSVQPHSLRVHFQSHPAFSCIWTSGTNRTSIGSAGELHCRHWQLQCLAQWLRRHRPCHISATWIIF